MIRTGEVNFDRHKNTNIKTHPPPKHENQGTVNKTDV
jgi:hypothetical protein